jgi:hypothetical protein
MKMEAPPENSISLPQYAPHPISRQRVVLILVVVVLVFVVPAIWFIRLAFCPGLTPPMRSMSLLVAALLLFLPVRAARVSIARKWRTGRWTISPEERSQRRANYATRRNPAWFKSTMTILDATTALIWISLLTLCAVQVLHHHQSAWSLYPVSFATWSLWQLYRKLKRQSAAKP